MGSFGYGPLNRPLCSPDTRILPSQRHNRGFGRHAPVAKWVRFAPARIGFVWSRREMGSFESPRSADQVPTKEIELNPHGLLKFGANWLCSGNGVAGATDPRSGACPGAALPGQAPLRGSVAPATPIPTFMGWGEPSEGHDCSFGAGTKWVRFARRELGSFRSARNGFVSLGAKWVRLARARNGFVSLGAASRLTFELPKSRRTRSLR